MSAIQGPFGLWPFPLLNLAMRLMQSKGQTQRPLLPAPAPLGGGASVVNLEEIEWTDRKGNLRTMRVRREIR